MLNIVCTKWYLLLSTFMMIGYNKLTVPFWSISSINLTLLMSTIWKLWNLLSITGRNKITSLKSMLSKTEFSKIKKKFNSTQKLWPTLKILKISCLNLTSSKKTIMASLSILKIPLNKKIMTNSLLSFTQTLNKILVKYLETKIFLSLTSKRSSLILNLKKSLLLNRLHLLL